MMSLLRHPRRNTLKTILVWVCLMIPASAFLYSTNNHARTVENDMNTIQRQIAEEKEALRILRAEWAYLNNPQRLASQTKQYFSDAKAMVAAQVLPMKSLTQVASQETAPAETPDSTVHIAATKTIQPLLAKPISYDHRLLAALHRDTGQLPSSASWTQKMVSALGLFPSRSRSMP